MNAQDALKLARRFIELPQEKRRLFLEGLQQQGVDFALFPIPAEVLVDERDGLSYAQQRMWFLWQLDPQSAAYNLPMAVRLNGELDNAALQSAFDGLVARHETLRSQFSEQDGVVRQRIVEPFAVSIACHDLSALATDAREEQVRTLADAEALAPFDLAHGPLLRVQLLKLADQEHVLLLTLHHIVADGWSYNVLIDEFIRLYDAASSGSDAALQPLPIQYRDYALWQRSWLEAGEQDRQLDYWRAKLGDDHAPLELPIDHSRPVTPSYRGARHEFQVEPALAERLRGLAREQGVTLFMVLLAAFKVLLHRYSGQQAIRVGVPVANRNRAEVEGLIGCFINTQVLHTEIDPLIDVRELLQRVKETALGAQGHQELPFERLVEAFGLDRSLSISPLFQVMFNHQSQVADAGAIKGQSGLSIAALERETRIAQFDLSLDTYEKGGKLFAAFGYATDLFDSRTVAQMAGHYSNLLLALATQPQARVCELVVLDDEQRRQIVQGWNVTQVDYPLHRGVHQLIEAQAEQTPQAPALTFGAQTLTYAELNARANRLAHHLIAQGVQPDGLVGIAAERSVEMVVGLLAILKAGGAYVPLDPEYPTERLAYMLEDSGIRLLLSQSHLDLPLSEGVQRIDLDQQGDWLAGFADSNPQVLLTGEHLAYVIYTSGSTGKPKGAGNRHSALTNRLCWMQQAYGLEASDSVMQKTPFSFDVSVWEFFWPLMTGARLVVAQPGAHRDPAQLVELINRENISTLHFVPSMLQAFLQDANVGSCSSLKRILCSGEALPVDAQLQVFSKLPQAGLYNLYGPTEAAIDVTHWTCVDEGCDAVPIGLPISNLGCHVLDANLEPVPVGVLGELYLFGEGLARGYHQRPALTGERFVASPFADGARMYRTGDLARYRNDGVIEYAGRIDHQVKLRGLRIELGEIEARLLEHESVRETAVLAVDGKHLVGYVVLAQQSDDWRESLAAYLAQSLPDYMVPAQWIDLAQMPLSPNGKLDRKALPRPDAGTAQTEYAAPQNGLEQRIAEIWQDVLKREQIGRNDNFFELGGDSIVSIQVVSRARQAGIQFSPKDLFLHQTVRSLAAVAETGTEVLLIDQGPAIGDVQLTPVQHWFFELPMSERQHWNQSLLLDAQQPIVAERLEQALQAVVQRHDALRLRYASEGGSWRQWYADVGTEQNLLWQGPDSEAFQDEVQRSLNLAEGPLLRAALMDRPEGGQRLLLAIHHLVVDGVSWRILLEDLQIAYQGLALPAKTSSYQSWAARLEALVNTEQRQQELDGWLTRLQGPVQELPRDNPDGGLLNKHGATLDICLDAEHTERLLKQAPAAYRTQVNDLLLTALARVLCRWSGNESVLVQMEGHGREDLFDDIDLTRTVGWFTSLYPVKLTPVAELSASLKAVKEQLRDVPEKGLGYGLLRYLGSPQTRQALAALPQPRVTFNYLGQFDSQFDEKALFTPAGKGGGQAQADDAPLANWLSVEGQVYGGELSLRWGYSAEMYRAETIQRLADELVAELHAVIEHCTDTQTFAVTPSDFPLAKLTQAQLDDLPVAARDIEDIYPLSPMQQGMLFHTLYEQEGGDYINQMRVDVDGLNVEQFRKAWQDTLNAHDILRTAFFWKGDVAPIQVVKQHVEIPLIMHDWRGQSSQVQRLDALAQAERSQGFELSSAPLLRLVLVRTHERRYHMIQTHHHILIDGWSNAQLLAEVLQRYAGQPVTSAGGRYHNYIEWLQTRDTLITQAFWEDQLAPLSVPTRLSAGTYRDVTGQGQYLRQIDPQTTRQLAEFAQRHKITVNTLLQGAWALLVQRHCGQQTVAFGTTVSGRPAQLQGIEAQIGLFINTLPVIATPQPQQSVVDYLQWMQELNLALREHEHTPLYDIQRWAGQGGDALFDSILVFENFPVADALRQSPGELVFSTLDSHEQTNYPLTLGITLGQSLTLEYVFAKRSFDEQTIAGLNQHLLQLLQQIVANAHKPLGELTLLDSEQHRQALRDWHQSNQALPKGGVAAAFSRQVAVAPDKIALIHDDEHLSYAELDYRAQCLARGLRARGVGPQALVAIAAERSFDLVVGLLAILKSGAGYLPLDPSYPAQRLDYMMRDSGARWLLCQDSLIDQVPCPQTVERLPLQVAAWPTQTDKQVLPEPDGGTLAYVIYTSGSTGQPKGVAVSQAALVGHCQAAAQFYGVGPSDCQLWFASVSFDAAAEQLFMPLLVGARVLLGDPGQWSAMRLADEVERHGVTIVDVPPAYLKQQAEALHHSGRQIGVRTCIIGGEAWDAGLLVQQAVQAQNWFNAYGPTEAVITPLAWRCQIQDDAALAIGRALGSRRACILDSTLQPCAPGMAGELCIGGQGLADGYLGRPGQTAERFVADPFSAAGERLYRTGDLARYRADGQIEFLGRVDQQVKIRGFRIETGEIEAHLLAHPQVAQAAVVAVDAVGGPQLAAYLVLGDPLQSEALLAEVRDWLAERLPAYMQPTSWQWLAGLPRNANGKLDRKALPKPVTETRRQGGEAPRQGLEQQVAAIWEQLLGVERVARDEQFFELGGHSLSAIRMISRLRHDLQIEVPVRALFEQPVLADFVAGLKQLAAGSAPALQALPRDRALPLSYAQQRMWFLWKLESHSAAYHLPSVLRVRGCLNMVALQQAFNELVSRHETLRTRFEEIDGQAYQMIMADAPLPVVLEECPGASEQSLRERVEAQIREPFDLEQGVLVRVRLLRLAQDDHVLIVTQHHIVSDAWSTQVLVEELVQCYAAFDKGEPASLTALAVQYADYAVWQRAWMDAGERERQLGYWTDRLAGEQFLQLPTDFPRPAEQSFRGAQRSLILPEVMAQGLRQLAQRLQVTPFMLLLASFQVLLHRYSGQGDIRVGVPVANRNRLETERLIGFFVNTQVLRVDVEPGMSFSSLLEQVRQAALQAQAHQDLPFEQLVEALHPERSLSHSPLFQVMFNHQREGAGDASKAQIPGLHVEPLEWENHSAQFDLTLNTVESGAGLSATWIYATDLFRAQTIESLSQHWLNLLQAIIDEPQQRVGELPMLGTGEREHIERDWNANRLDFDREQCIHRLIEAQVLRTPQALAVIWGEEQLDYATLNARANRLARHLVSLGAGPEVRVGVAMPRGLPMLIALLAVLKSGSTYVPLDPDYPSQRVAYMLEDSCARILLTERAVLDVLQLQGQFKTVLLDQWSMAQGDSANLDDRAVAGNLAYVIYTSGSTGQPKGVAITHRNVAALAAWSQQVYSQEDIQGVLASTSICFDLSVWELFVTLSAGGLIVGARNALELPELAARERVKLINTVPSAANALLRAGQIPQSVRIINLAGEPLKQSLVESLYTLENVQHVYDLYGPSEDTTYSTWTRREIGGHANIGRPLPNTASYLLDDELLSVPVGIPAELYLAGDGITRGYLLRPGLTAEKYLPNPFAADGSRLYRTGDLARYGTHGVLEYAGRIDHQIKVRGLRIELGEIEACLQALGGLRESAVLAVELNGSAQLVAYVVAQDKEADEALLGKTLKAGLQQRLPDYMVPSHLLFLDALPLSPNGKLDRKALPLPDARQHQQQYVAPQTAPEQQVAVIWAEVLKVDRVGLT
ncbi:amino acid adenylation domain-containing protein, partial [Pseudomonas sp. 21LCFQ02]|uniref:non-ribosomal peptide synthetase n=1 Tax=Pseudomonas sp. 21LCFQ02 TaxID=2957505 RepID=UPI00209A8497